MRVVSLNAWGGAVFDQLSPWISQVGGDVVCLQEVTRTPGLTGWTTFQDGERSLPQRANLFDDVRRLLPEHQGFFVASDAGPVLDDSRHTHQQDFGLAIFVHNRLPVIGQAARFVHGSFVDHREWTITDRPRIAQGLRLVNRESKGPARHVSILHAHGLRDPAGKHDTPARRNQAVQLAALVDAIREPDDLTILCGDLNLLPDSETFSALTKIGLTDLGRHSRHPDHALQQTPSPRELPPDLAPGQRRSFRCPRHPRSVGPPTSYPGHLRSRPAAQPDQHRGRPISVEMR